MSSSSRVSFLPNSWKGHNQVLCFTFIVLIILGIGVYTLCYLLLTLSIQILEESSTNIFEKEIHNQINRYSSIQQTIANLYFTQSQINIQNMNQLFWYIQTTDIQTVNPPKCLFKEDVFDSYVRKCLYCSDFCNKTGEIQTDNYKHIFHFTTLLSEYMFVYNMQLYTYFGHKDDSQYFTVSEVNVPNGFMPHKRQWYIDHIKSMTNTSQTFISSPYFSVAVDTIYIAFTQSMTTPDYQFQGVIGQDADLSLLPKFNDGNVMPTIINQEGDLIMSAFYKRGQSEIAKIYNETITGFTEKDWEYLRKEADEKISVNMHIYNSLYQKEIQISIIKIEILQFYIILTINEDKYLRDQDILLDKFKEYQTQILALGLYAFISVLAVILVVENFFLRKLQTDLTQISKLARYKMNAIKSIKNKTIFVQSNNQSIKKLISTFKNLLTNFANPKVKGEICQQIEKLQYPTKRVRANASFHQISEKLESQRVSPIIDAIKVLILSVKTIYGNKNQGH